MSAFADHYLFSIDHSGSASSLDEATTVCSCGAAMLGATKYEALLLWARHHEGHRTVSRSGDAGDGYCSLEGTGLEAGKVYNVRSGDRVWPGRVPIAATRGTDPEFWIVTIDAEHPEMQPKNLPSTHTWEEHDPDDCIDPDDIAALIEEALRRFCESLKSDLFDLLRRRT